MFSYFFFHVIISETQSELGKNVFKVWVLQTELLKHQPNEQNQTKQTNKWNKIQTFFIQLVKTALCFFKIKGGQVKEKKRKKERKQMGWFLLKWDWRVTLQQSSFLALVMACPGLNILKAMKEQPHSFSHMHWLNISVSLDSAERHHSPARLPPPFYTTDTTLSLGGLCVSCGSFPDGEILTG